MKKFNLPSIIFIFICFTLFIFAFKFIINLNPDFYKEDFRVNDDSTNTWQSEPDVDVDTSGNFVVCWMDNRNILLYADVYAQIYDQLGNPIGNNIKIGQDTSTYPKISFINQIKFVIVWRHYYSINNLKYCNLYFQLFNKSGSAQSNLISVADTVISQELSGIQFNSIDSDLNGNFIIAWNSTYATGGPAKIFFQRYDSLGNRVGTRELVNESQTSAFSPDIAVNRDGSFIIAWKDRRINYIGDIFMQRYDANGIKIGNNVKVNDDPDPAIEQEAVSIATNGFGYTVLTWSDDRVNPPYPYIFYQIYDSLGNPIGPNNRADVAGYYVAKGRSRVYVRNDKYFYIGWLDQGYSIYDLVYGRKFNSIGEPIGIPYLIPNSSNADQSPGRIRIVDDKVYSVWTDNRSSHYDIYCNIRGFQNPDTVIGINHNSNTIADKFILYQNFPNPFNPKTIIRFDVPNPLSKGGRGDDLIQLDIYNISGQFIENLVSRHLSLGTYEVEWDGSSYPSGIYFYSLTVNDFKQSKKAILLK